MVRKQWPDSLPGRAVYVPRSPLRDVGRGSELYESWRAIHLRNDAYYWDSSADAVFRMRVFLGLDVLLEGTIVIRPEDL
jgi:hypothetical protein